MKHLNNLTNVGIAGRFRPGKYLACALARTHLRPEPRWVEWIMCDALIQRKSTMKKAILLSAVIAIFALPLQALAQSTHVTFYKNPHCTCCEKYASYLRNEGFDVDIKATDDLEGITLKAGVPERLVGCHTMFIDGYVVIGHVAVDVVRKLVSERPAIVGISIPGMPWGVPGMEDPKAGPVAVYAVSKDKDLAVYDVQ